MPAQTPDERALIARLASHERWGRTEDRVAATAPARAGLRARFEREADPQGTLSPAERALRAEHLMQAHMLRMSLAAKRSRRRARENIVAAEAAEAALREAGAPGAC